MFAQKRWILVLAVLAFVFARLTGAHLHLCFDGSEPPLSLHTDDSAHVEHHEGGSQHHEDMDVDAVSDALTKPAKLDLPVLAVFAALLIVLLAPVRTLAPENESRRIPLPLRRFLRPPLRAPPA